MQLDVMLRRSAEACHKELSFIAWCTHQLVLLSRATAQATVALAAAAAEFISNSRVAQQTARLQLAVSSGRLVMLLLLLVLGTVTGGSAVWSRCAARKLGAAQQLQQLVSGLQQLVALLPWLAKQQQRRGWLSSYGGPSSVWCLVGAAGKQQPCYVHLAHCDILQYEYATMRLFFVHVSKLTACSATVIAAAAAAATPTVIPASIAHKDRQQRQQLPYVGCHAEHKDLLRPPPMPHQLSGALCFTISNRL